MTAPDFAFSSATPEHGTPPEIVRAARRVMGGIDLDPATSEEFQQVVQAERYYTRQDDGLRRLWSGRVFLNPPSGENGSLVKRFWDALVELWHYEEVTEAIWVGFSIDQLQTLQNTSYGGPLSRKFPLCIPRQRLRFSTSLETVQAGLFGDADPTPVTGDSPTKPNFIAYLPPAGDAMAGQRFLAEFEQFGEVRL